MWIATSLAPSRTTAVGAVSARARRRFEPRSRLDTLSLLEGTP